MCKLGDSAWVGIGRGARAGGRAEALGLEAKVGDSDRGLGLRLELWARAEG